MLNLVSGDDEPAGILSHELSHELAGHFREGTSLNFLGGSLVIGLLPMFVGVFFAPRLLLTAIPLLASSGFMSLYQSRRREEEADYISTLLMGEVGFDPAAITSFWQNLINFMDSTGNRHRQRPTLLGTHPQVNLTYLVLHHMSN